MRSLRIVLLVVLISLSMLALAQNTAQPAAQKPADQMDHSTAPQSGVTPAPTEAQKSFATLKALAGTWQGVVTLNPPMKNTGMANMEVSLRVTSRGNVLVHEMKEAGMPDDPKKYDHPVTMFYLDGEQLSLVHYCDAGNRPHMTARVSPDGKTVEFDFVDLAGSNQRGHMYHAVFTIIDENHHIEDWTYLLPNDKPMKAHMELQRTNAAGGASSGK